MQYDTNYKNTDDHANNFQIIDTNIKKIKIDDRNSKKRIIKWITESLS